MRKVIAEEWISLDGYVSDREGRLDFFAGTVRQIYSDADRIKFLDSIDCILYGRTTYQQFVTLWPQRPIDEPLAKAINTTKKIIFSSTLSDAPWGQWAKAEIESGDVVSRVRQMKSTHGKDILVWASISLAQALMKENLIDEYHLHVCPTLTAGGRKLFTESIKPTHLKLQEVKRFDAGTVFLKYVTLRNL